MTNRTKTASWVIIRRYDGAVIAETFNWSTAYAVSRTLYRVVSISTHLQNLNGANR